MDRREPFRVFFPLGTLIAWVGVGHWVAYWAGATTSYSCLAHGLVQTQGFILAFALGFLLTAIPRRTESSPPTRLAIVALGAALAGSTAAAFAEAWLVAEVLTIGVLASIVAFAVPRFVRGGRRPPPPFVLLPMGIACGIAGAALIGWGAGAGGPAAAVGLGRLFVEQGMLLCLVMGAGALVLPLMAGATPPRDIDGSPESLREVASYVTAGVLLVATLVAEAKGSERWAPVVRGGVVALVLGFGAGLARPASLVGWNRRAARLAAWLVPAGVALSGILPDYRVPALHVTFIGGFGILAIAVATHVTASHLELATLRDGRSRVVAVVVGAALLAMIGRVTADATNTYFEHLAAAGTVWIAGTAVWMGALVPHWLRRR